MTNNEPKSWGEAIRAYETSKQTLPWQPAEVDPVEKLNAFQRGTLEREVNPILMKYRDPNKEKDFTKTLQAKIDAKKTKGQAGQPFNIINHAGPRRTNILVGSQTKETRKWNILSHMPRKLHAMAPTKFDQDFQIECTKRRSAFHEANTLVRGRDYNILSNKFNENDSARRLQDHMKVQDHIRKEYYRTHIYDPIKVQSYDETDERSWQENFVESIKRRRQHQEESIPRSTKYAEGNTYNIITTAVTNADRLLEKPDRALNRFKGSATKIKAAKAIGDEQATIEEARRLNRISYDRWEKTIDRGYDFVFGGPVELKPLPCPKPSIWTRLHTDEVIYPKTSAGIRLRTKDLSNVQPASEPIFDGSLSSTAPSILSNNSKPMTASSSLSCLSPAISASNSARDLMSLKRESSRVPPLDLMKCPVSPVSYKVPENSLPGEPIAMVRTGGGLSTM